VLLATPTLEGSNISSPGQRVQSKKRRGILLKTVPASPPGSLWPSQAPVAWHPPYRRPWTGHPKRPANPPSGPPPGVHQAIVAVLRPAQALPIHQLGERHGRHCRDHDRRHPDHRLRHSDATLGYLCAPHLRGLHLRCCVRVLEVLHGAGTTVRVQGRHPEQTYLRFAGGSSAQIGLNAKAWAARLHQRWSSPPCRRSVQLSTSSSTAVADCLCAERGGAGG
jgi:hypothetical protein